MRWLVLLVALPPSPTRHRVGFWRKLRRLGAVSLKSGAWILPETPDTTEAFQWLAQEIQSVGGEATLLRVDRIESLSQDDVAGLFHRARQEEYEGVIRECRAILAQLDRQESGGRPALPRLRSRLDALHRELQRIARVDHLAAPLGARARQLWETTARRLRALDAPAPAGRPPARARSPLPPRGSAWVTRPRPQVDRIASAWLVKRFLDPDATFAFADDADAAAKGVPFDVLGAEFGHHGDDTTFETLLKRFRVRDRRLQAIAEIVHEADLRDGKFSRAEAEGLDVALRALAAAVPDDHELLERGMTVFDGLYAMSRPRTRPGGGSHVD